MVKKNSRKKMNRRGGQETTWPRIVGIILMVAVVIVVLFLLVQGAFGSLFGTLFPDYYPKNLSEAELRDLGCDKAVAQIQTQGFIGLSEQVLFMYQSNHYANLIWDYKGGKIYYRDGDRLTGSLVTVGDIVKGVVKIKSYFLDPNSEMYLKYKYDPFTWKGMVATTEDLKLLDNSFKLENENYLCKSDGQYQDFKDSQACVINCAIIDGNCKVSGDSGEISYGKLGCNTGECFVAETEDKQVDGGLKIDTFQLMSSPNGYGALLAASDLKNTNQISLDNGVSRPIEFKILNSDSFCYTLTTDKEILYKNYNNKFDVMGLKIVSLNPSVEKSLQLVAWAGSKKIVKRVKLDISESKYKDGTQINDGTDFKSKITSADIGSIFYVSTVPIQNGALTGEYNSLSNFRVTKKSQEALTVEGEIFVDSVNSEGVHGKVSSWKQLNCNTWTTNSNLYINKIESGGNSFREAVLKNCQLNKWWGWFG